MRTYAFYYFYSIFVLLYAGLAMKRNFGWEICLSFKLSRSNYVPNGLFELCFAFGVLERLRISKSVTLFELSIQRTSYGLDTQFCAEEKLLEKI